MAKIDGDWFHSRSTSNLSELLKIRLLLFESQKLKYIGKSWSAGRNNNPELYDFAETVGISPSAMQTKIRTMIRNGFIRENKICPLQFTRIGQLWNDLYTIGNFEAATKLYQLTLTVALAIYAFKDDSYSFNPLEGQLPLKFLFNNLQNGTFAVKDLKYLVDGSTKRIGKNLSYWKGDLLNTGLFFEKDGYLVYNGKHPELVKEIKDFEPNPLYSKEDWLQIRENPLIKISPFSKTVEKIFDEIIDEKNIEDYNEIQMEPLLNLVDAELSDEDLINKTPKYSQYQRENRDEKWSYRVKKDYQFICVTPSCDVEGLLFIEAAHIKPFKEISTEIPHKTHPLNGLCLCKHCHKLFDNGFLALNDDFSLLVSQRFNQITDQHLKKVIFSSQNLPIKQRIDKRNPILEFVEYHRNKIFKP